MKFQGSGDEYQKWIDEGSQKINEQAEVDLEQKGQANNDQWAIHKIFEKILKKHPSFSKAQEGCQKRDQRRENKIRVRKPRSSQLSFFLNIFDLKIIKITEIMAAAYNGEQLRQSQIKQLQQQFKLNKDNIKLMSPSDPKVLQTLRYLIFHGYQIPNSLVKVVDRMARTHFLKVNEPSLNLFANNVKFAFLNEQFEPPLDLYLDFVDSGFIKTTNKELIEVFTKNQNLYERLHHDKQIYSTSSQKKRLILNQFPYMVDIFNRIYSKGNKNRFKYYLDNILTHLQVSNEGQLLDRYLPEVKCSYLQLKVNISLSDIQFLLISLKNICEVSTDDFQTLYNIKPVQVVLMVRKSFSLINFYKNLELCSNLMTNKDFHLSQQELTQMSEQLNFQKCFSIDAISNNLILVMFRQQAFKGRLFSKSLIKNIQWLFKCIPDKKKKKQCCYILIIQYFLLIHKNPGKNQQIINHYAFPQQQMEEILDEGRFIALDLLLCQEQTTLILKQDQLIHYMQIVKKFIIRTKNKPSRIKANELLKKLSKANNYPCSRLSFYEENISKNNQLVELIEEGIQNGERITQQGIMNVLQILESSNDPQVRKICLRMLKTVLRNHQKEFLPQIFSKTLIMILTKLYFQSNLLDGTKAEMLDLALQCTNLIDSYKIIDILTKFLLKVYVQSPSNSIQNINSSFGIYNLVLGLKWLRHNPKIYEEIAKEQLEKLLIQISRNYKKILQPMKKGNLNMLCTVLVIAKNKVALPFQLIQTLSSLAKKNRDLAELPLLAIYFHMKNYKMINFSQNSLMNICQILKLEEDHILAISILQKYVQNLSSVSNKSQKVINQIQSLKKENKNRRVCILCQQTLEYFSQSKTVKICDCLI